MAVEMNLSAPYLLLFNRLSNAHDCGGKASGLQRLIAMGLEVPVTYCLSSKAYERFLERNNLREIIAEVCARAHLSDEQRSDAIDDAFCAAVIPDEINEAIRAQKIFKNQGNRWAVRSSSNLEDMRASSSAGIYESFLNVAGTEDILSAVRKTWASLWSARAIAYRRKSGLDDIAVGMAVIVQQMVDAVYSGALFTVDPMGKSDNRLIIEYCQGCGDQLVSGAITPFVVEVDREGSAVRHLRAPAFPAIGDPDWITLRDIAMRVRAQLGAEQDIEWAWDGHAFQLLQARPVTTPGNRLGETRLEDLWTRANIGEVLPGPVTPLTWRIFLATLTNRPQSAFEPTGQDSIEGGLGIRLINGRAYIRLDRFLDSFCYLPFVTPEVMQQVLGAPLHESIQRYQPPRGVAVTAARLVFWSSISGFYDRIGRLANGLAQRPSIDSSAMDTLIGWSSNCFSVHLKATYYAVGAFALLTRLLAGTDIAGLMDRMTAFGAEGGYQSADQGIKIAELASVVSRHPALREYLLEGQKAGTTIDNAMADIPGGAEFSGMFENFMRHNGARTAGEFELATPRWREDHSFVIDSILSMTRRKEEAPSRRDIPAGEMKSGGLIIPGMGICRAFLLKRVFGCYQRLVRLRENLKYRLMEGYADLRTLIMGKADRFVKTGMLQRAEDIFFLQPGEILALENDSASKEEMARLIAERGASFAKANELCPPDLVTGNGFAMTSEKEHDDVMGGIGCSGGMISGPARVILDIADAHQLQPGEILVAKSTDPGWTPLFLICKAVITEAGGILSHGATVAREYGIPAVASVKDATVRISTGDFLQVDGGVGEVVVLRRIGNLEVRGSELTISQSG